MEALEHAVAQFEVIDVELVIDRPALTAVRRSLDESGLLLLGEMHGVRENPLLVRALMRAFGLNALALEWDDELAPVIDAFVTSGVLEDHPWLWFGDGRITAGHLALLRELAGSGSLDLTLFDGVVSAGASWSARDEMMAGRILAGASALTATAAPTATTGTTDTTAVTAPTGTTAATGTTGILAVAGNAHTPTKPTSLGIPLGACLSGKRPGVRDIHIRYGSGGYYNNEPRRFSPDSRVRHGPVRLHLDRGRLILDLPEATEATVPQRPLPAWPAQPRQGTGPGTSSGTAPSAAPETSAGTAPETSARTAQETAPGTAQETATGTASDRG